MRTSIEVKVRVEGVHQWPEAPVTSATSFLSSLHRHDFVIRARFYVNHDDRQLEFFAIREILLDTIPKLASLWKGSSLYNFGDMSCEHIAKNLYLHMPMAFKPYLIGVWEDDENGAIVEFD